MQEEKYSIQFQLKTSLDVEIEKFKKLMIKVPRKRNIDVRNEVNKRRQMIVQERSGEVNEKLQNKVWKPRELKATIAEVISQHKEIDDQLQHKVWDPTSLLH